LHKFKKGTAQIRGGNAQFVQFPRLKKGWIVPNRKKHVTLVILAPLGINKPQRVIALTKNK